MSHGLNAQQVDNLPHCHILFGHLTDTGDIALTWKHNTGQTLLHGSKLYQLMSQVWLVDHTNDDDEKVEHLFGQSIPLNQFILQIVFIFISVWWHQIIFFLSNCVAYLVFAWTTPIKIIKELKSQQDQHEEVVGVHFGSSYL